MTVIFKKCDACLLKDCDVFGCAITRRPVYKGPPARPVQPTGAEFACCEGCTTSRKCADLGKCQGDNVPAAKKNGAHPATHDLKTWPEYFCPVRGGLKTFEVRFNDRDYQEGDRLYLREFIPHAACNGTGRVWDNGDKTECSCKTPHGQYTGRQEIHVISYVLREYVGLQPGYVVLGLQPLIRS